MPTRRKKLLENFENKKKKKESNWGFKKKKTKKTGAGELHLNIFKQVFCVCLGKGFVYVITHT